MPVHKGKDKNGCYAQWGSSGKKYYYTCGDDNSRKQAEQKAQVQGIAVKSKSGKLYKKRANT